MEAAQPCKMVVGRPMVHAYSGRDNFWYTTPSFETMYLVPSWRFLPVLCEKLEKLPVPAGYKWRIRCSRLGNVVATYKRVETEHAQG